MTKKEYIELHQQLCLKMVEITKKKNQDYSGAGDDPFANFRHIGNLVQAASLDVVAIGFLTRLSDKMSRVGSFISNGTLAVQDESVEDTLLDGANYCLLFLGYLTEMKANAGRRATDMKKDVTPGNYCGLCAEKRITEINDCRRADCPFPNRI